MNKMKEEVWDVTNHAAMDLATAPVEGEGKLVRTVSGFVIRVTKEAGHPSILK